MNIFPLFENKRDAFKLWKKTVNWWPDDKIMLTFVEAETKYWFILYCKSSVLNQNLGFVKSIPMSQNYQKFKTESKRLQSCDSEFTRPKSQRLEEKFQIMTLNY